jgi:hypothetical protein
LTPLQGLVTFDLKEDAMAKIISLREKRLLKSMEQDIDFSLAHLMELGKKLPVNDGIRRCSTLNGWFWGLISREIFRRNMVSEDIYLCGIYIAAMLASVDCDLKKYAVDFLEKWSQSSDPHFLKMGGDFCFILCGGFSARCENRMMRFKDYQEMGVSFYDWFYSSTGKPIGHYMSVNFEVMQQIASSVITNGH